MNLELKKSFVGFASLLGSGVVSAVGFILIVSGRWHIVDSSVAVFIVLFVQWQTLALTVSKLGVEQAVFALVTARGDIRLNIGPFLLRTATPLAAFCAAILSFAFSPWAGVVALISVVLDASSLIIVAELNARKEFRAASVANLLNYPLFFLFLAVVGLYRNVDQGTALALFLATSAVRWLWLWLRTCRLDRSAMTPVDLSCTTGMGIQQGLNYLLFRADQVLLATVGLKGGSPADAAMYLFLAKLPELAAGVMVIAGTVYFPKRFVAYPHDYRALLQGAKRYPLLAAYLFFFAALATGYALVWTGRAIPLVLILPFLCHALSILPVNNITYSMLRQGYLEGLNRKLVVAVGIGLPVFAFFAATGNMVVLAWLVPIQLATFCAFGMFRQWGRQRPLYA